MIARVNVHRAAAAILLAVLTVLVAACGDSTWTPEPSAGPTPEPPIPGDVECTRDEDCALLPYVTCCGECPPAPPFEVGTREDLDAIFIEAETRCALDRRPCRPPRCDPMPPGCYARAGCRDGRCVVETDGCS